MFIAGLMDSSELIDVVRDGTDGSVQTLGGDHLPLYPWSLGWLGASVADVPEPG